jgi:hypothetical protein
MRLEQECDWNRYAIGTGMRLDLVAQVAKFNAKRCVTVTRRLKGPMLEVERAKGGGIVTKMASQNTLTTLAVVP